MWNEKTMETAVEDDDEKRTQTKKKIRIKKRKNKRVTAKTSILTKPLNK